MSLIARYAESGGPPRLGAVHDDGVVALPFGSLAAALRVPLAGLREAVEQALGRPSAPLASVRLLAPVDAQEVWGAGLTYRRDDAPPDPADPRARAHRADRPELFFKSTGRRVVASGERVGVRADSGWNAPEAEVAMVLNAGGEIAGWTVGDDVTARAIQAENPLYGPQAKAYARACALGPGIRPAWELPPDPVFEIDLAVRRGGEIVEQGSTDTSRMVRGWAELAAWLTRALEFPDGAVLLTGTGIATAEGFSLREGDEISITVAGVGTLRNAVATVGTNIAIERARAAAHANER